MPGDLSLLLILEPVKGVDLVPIKTVGHSDVAIVIVTQGLTSTGLPAVGASDTAPNRTWSKEHNLPFCLWCHNLE